jgi:hypothetical protein
MTNVSPIKIDTTDGRLPLKGKGLEMTEFANAAELRRNQLEKLAAGFRMFAYFGFNEGVAGHITLRDPEFSDHFWVNPLGVHFSQISVSDLILVNHEGKVVQGDKDVNVAAFRNSFKTSCSKTGCKCCCSFSLHLRKNFFYSRQTS